MYWTTSYGDATAMVLLVTRRGGEAEQIYENTHAIFEIFIILVLVLI